MTQSHNHIYPTIDVQMRNMNDKKSKLKRRHLSKDSECATLLKDLVDQLDLLLTVGNQPVAVARYSLDGVLRMRKSREYRLRAEALKRLREKQLLKIDKNADNYQVALSGRGLIENFRLRVLDAEIFEEGKFCIAVFDIPERHRALRDRLRYFLREAGFHPIQKSVWISPFNATDALNDLFRATNSKKWVKVYTAIEY